MTSAEIRSLRAKVKMALDVIGPYPFPPPGPRDCMERKMLRRIEGILKEALGE